MKTYIVTYRYRGSNYSFMTPSSIRVRALTAADAKREAILQLGDVYRALKATPVK